MSFDFAAGLTSVHEEKVIEPEEIFRKQTSGKNLWLGQGDALRDWFENRDKNDIVLAMDTGMGKTIVGLLIAHSIMNEKSQKVIYVCASKQLVEQTVSEANEIGIEVASYMDGDYSNGFSFHDCTAPLVTTYQALFNGKSKFFREDIGGLIFDDSHVADTVIKDSFTLSIKRSSALYLQIAKLFESYFNTVKQDVRYKQVLEEKNDEVFIFPPFEVKHHLETIKKFFEDSKVDEDTDTLFAWAHLKDNLDMCLFLINQNKIEITPPIIPAKTLPYFQEKVSRVYLSATHVSTDYFPRYYGNKIAHRISHPSGKSKSKKFIISPHRCNIGFKSTQAVRQSLMSNLQSFKSLIITPSFYGAEPWKKIDADLIIEATSRNIVQKIEEFKSSDNKKLILANRYDGIDFPDDTCRVLILDGLPSERGLLDSYFANQLKVDNYIRTEMNAKILQGMGRIFRGADDYGIVFLAGEKEIKWIATPKNLMNFPPLMQIQLKVGNRLNSMITEESFESLIHQVLTKKQGLMKAYENFIDEEIKNAKKQDHTEQEVEQEKMEKLSLIESHLFSSLWQRDYEHIERFNEDLLNNSKDFDATIFSWHNFIAGLTLQAIGKEKESLIYFFEANRISKVTPKPLANLGKSFIESEIGLVNTITNAISNLEKSIQLQNMQQQFQYLDEGKFPKQDKKHELGIEFLGKYLGFETDRPDNRYKTGPDVLWELPENKFVLFELKTNRTTGTYPKKDTGQFLDHIEWVKREKKINDEDILHQIIVGPHNRVNHDANPSDDMYIIELNEFKQFAEELINITSSCYSPSFTKTAQVEQLISDNHLVWTERFDKMDKRKAIDLKD